MEPGVVVWFTGLPSSGKSTLAKRTEQRLLERGKRACLLDGDAVRSTLVPEPGYDETSRSNFYQTLAGLAALLANQGHTVLVAATAHRAEFRERARARAPQFIEVWVRTDASECERRDTKGLYAEARAGSVTHLPGTGTTYEAPTTPDITATGGLDDAAVAAILQRIEAEPSG